MLKGKKTKQNKTKTKTKQNKNKTKQKQKQKQNKFKVKQKQNKREQNKQTIQTRMFPVARVHCILATKFARSFFNDACLKKKSLEFQLINYRWSNA